jgi:DNA repair protein RecO (recombination protein O)
MPVLSSEAVILRTWPVNEADLIVSFFTRDYGRMKGIAKSALKSRKRFGGALEPMTLTRAWFAERPRQELVRLDQLEIMQSPLAAPIDPARLTALSFYAEVLDEILPEHDPQDAVYRLLVSVLEHTTASRLEAQPSETSGPWMSLTYFTLWMTRLMGLLPDLAHCIVCGEPLHGANPAVTGVGTGGDAATVGRGPGIAQPLTRRVVSGHDFSRAETGQKESRALAPEGSSSSEQPVASRHSGIFYSPFADGLFCEVHRTTNATALSPDSWQLAQRMLRAPAATFATEPWPRRRAQDLRRFTLQTLERHLERKLRTAEALARLGG